MVRDQFDARFAGGARSTDVEDRDRVDPCEGPSSRRKRERRRCCARSRLAAAPPSDTCRRGGPEALVRTPQGKLVGRSSWADAAGHVSSWREVLLDRHLRNRRSCASRISGAARRYKARSSVRSPRRPFRRPARPLRARRNVVSCRSVGPRFRRSPPAGDVSDTRTRGPSGVDLISPRRRDVAPGSGSPAALAAFGARLAAYRYPVARPSLFPRYKDSPERSVRFRLVIVSVRPLLVRSLRLLSAAVIVNVDLQRDFLPLPRRARTAESTVRLSRIVIARSPVPVRRSPSARVTTRRVDAFELAPFRTTRPTVPRARHGWARDGHAVLRRRARLASP